MIHASAWRMNTTIYETTMLTSALSRVHSFLSALTFDSIEPNQIRIDIDVQHSREIELTTADPLVERRRLANGARKAIEQPILTNLESSIRLYTRKQQTTMVTRMLQ